MVSQAAQQTEGLTLRSVHDADSVESREDIEKQIKKMEVRRSKALPDPTGWKILIKTLTIEEKTEGGIYIPEDTQALENVAVNLGYVMKMGPQCYSDKEKYGDTPWCKERDFIIFQSYAGTRLDIYRQEFRLINDDSVEAVVEDPRGIRRQR
jgi:co-chaperonin GroES (HSP10)